MLRYTYIACLVPKTVVALVLYEGRKKEMSRSASMYPIFMPIYIFRVCVCVCVCLETDPRRIWWNTAHVHLKDELI